MRKISRFSKKLGDNKCESTSVLRSLEGREIFLLKLLIKLSRIAKPGKTEIDRNKTRSKNY